MSVHSGLDEKMADIIDSVNDLEITSKWLYENVRESEWMGNQEWTESSDTDFCSLEDKIKIII
jgi:hypothetical protein